MSQAHALDAPREGALERPLESLRAPIVSGRRRKPDAGTHAPPQEPVHLAVERHAAMAPERLALEHQQARLTYGELDQRANRLARYLAARGAAAERRIVVCVEPSLHIAVALLAILKSGAVYVPLDPAYPAARIRAILDDTAPVLVLTQTHLLDWLELGEHQSVCLDSLEPELASWSSAPLGLDIHIERTASVYYTSGTTGTPKGVMASHANLATYLGVARDRFEVGPDDVMPAIARYSFSISMFELMLPLVSGAALRLLDRDHVLDPARMAATLREVTFFHAGPSLLRGLLAFIRRQGVEEGAYARVRHASSGGDMVPPELLESLKEVFPAAEVFVIYGCSEISCMGCSYPVPRERAVTRTYVGRPFEDVSVRVLDAELNTVPAGVVGEIHFAGGGVTKGYLNRPELTAEKFIAIDGARFYRTGDLGRFSDDGWLEILGRSDFQVKVRGMRVELAEVELWLRRAPGVSDGVVVAQNGPSGEGGERILCAYFVPAEGELAHVPTIRRHLAAALPDYMMPSLFVELERLPLNHNMKLDRRALPPPTEADRRRSLGRHVRPPETETETQLAELWAKHLRIDVVGLDDNFFELGGDSLLAMELVVDVQTKLGVGLDGMAVLRETLEVQAAMIQRDGPEPEPISGQRAKPLPDCDALELFHFGPGLSLFGALTRPEGPPRHAVLICSPVGQECARADFVLQRLARALAVQGVASLRFDWYGLRDSCGDSVDASPARWQEDVADAAAELRARTGARSVSAIGVRLGATLLAGVAPELELTSLVLWDPIRSGAEYLAQQRALHAVYLRSLRHLHPFGRRAPALHGKEEILGTTFSSDALRALEALELPEASSARLLSSVAAVDCRWDDLGRFEEIQPDTGITSALIALVLGGS